MKTTKIKSYEYLFLLNLLACPGLGRMSCNLSISNVNSRDIKGPLTMRTEIDHRVSCNPYLDVFFGSSFLCYMLMRIIDGCWNATLVK